MRPRFVIALSSLPRLPNGKVDARNLPAPLSARDPRQLGSPETALEKSVAELWREALSLEHVGPHENFFDLGGHSLLVLRIRARIQAVHDIELPVTDFFRHNTVATLARRLREAMGQPTIPHASGASAEPSGHDAEAPAENAQRRRAAAEQLRKKRGALRN